MSQRFSRAEEIVTVALDLAEATGAGGVTTAALARNLGFTEAALYRYYPGKATILAAALQHLAERLFATMVIELDAASAGDGIMVGEQLRRHIRRFAPQHGLLLELLLFATTSRSDALLEGGQALLDEYSERMATYFEQVRGRGAGRTLPVGAELARLWTCQLLGGFLRCRLSREVWDPATQVGFTTFVALFDSPRPVAT